MAGNLYLLVGLLALITVVRNGLELLGPLTGSKNFCCFYLHHTSFLNTFTYSLLLVFLGIFLLHLLLKGTRKQLHLLLLSAVLFMVPLFIMVPLINLALNYHGPQLTLWPLPGLYLPAGALCGFVVILGVLPVVVHRIYPERTLRKIIVSLLVCFTLMFSHTYILSLWLAYPVFYRVAGKFLPMATGHLVHMDVYSFLFIVPLVFTFPLLVKRFYPRVGRGPGWVVYGLVLALTGWQAVAIAWPVYLSYAKKPAKELRAANILIAHRGARFAKKSITRTPDEALRLAIVVAGQAIQAPHRFGELARKYSAGPFAKKGGELGVWRRGKIPAVIDRAVAALKPGQVSLPVKSPFGYHVLMRKELSSQLAVSMIVISHRHTMKSLPGVKRTREDASKLARQVAAQARAHPEKFTALARKHSSLNTCRKGTCQHRWTQGKHPAVDALVKMLKKGEIVGPVETPLGFLIIRREAQDGDPAKTAPTP